MNALTEMATRLIPSWQLVALGADAWLKSLVVLALAGAVCLAWRRASAATRHLIWLVAVMSLPFLPVLSLLPSGPRPLWSVSSILGSGNQVSLALQLAPASTPETLAPSTSPVVAANATPAARPSSSGGLLAARLGENWLLLALVAWGAGILLALARLIAGLFQLRNVSGSAQPLEAAGWELLLRQACQILRLRRPVILLQSSANVMPLTWGWRRAVVLLPSDAERWTEERRRIVLLHELAHIKRWDCLTQIVTRFVCAMFWCNPLVWFAARRMCIERERACDDLVLNGGCKASDYAAQLVEIARSFRRAPASSAIAMARPSGLGARVSAIVDTSRNRRERPVTLVVVLAALGAMIIMVGASRTLADGSAQESNSLREQQIAQLEAFSSAKEKQSETLAAAAGEQISPRFQRFFKAATTGDWQTITNMYEYFKEHHPQYSRKYRTLDLSLRTSYWQPVLEICLAYDHVVNCDPKYTQIAVDDIINSIPRGSIYFGGTDPGRGLPTAFCKSQIDADPFYTLTQNALADGTYLKYLEETYGKRSLLLSRFIEARRSDQMLQAWDAEMRQARQTLDVLYAAGPDDPACKAAEEAVNNLNQKIDPSVKGIWDGLEAEAGAPGTNLANRSIFVPTSKDLQRCFKAYVADAQRRLKEHKLKPGEDVAEISDGPGLPKKVVVSGQVAVMQLNGLMTKIIFDRNPDREFYIEESFPLDWMYPHLEPHGLIMKIDRQPLPKIPDAVVQRDHAFWRQLVGGMIGDWLSKDTPVSQIAAFATKVQLKRDFSGFTGDPRFVENDYARRLFSKERANIARLYTWRMNHTTDAAQKKRMGHEADYAFRQAFALCPNSPELVSQFADFLTSQHRPADAALVKQTAALFPSPGKPPNAKPAQPAAATAKSPVFQIRQVLGAASPDADRMVLVSRDQASGQALRQEILHVRKTVLLDQTDVKSASAITNAMGFPLIDITFTEKGRRKFAEVSRENLHQRLAIIIDGKVRCAPVIASEIAGGMVEVAGDFTPRAAKTLAREINVAAGE